MKANKFWLYTYSTIYLIHTPFRVKMQESMKRMSGDRMICQLQDGWLIPMETLCLIKSVSFTHLDNKFQFSIDSLSLLELGKQLLSLVQVVVVSILRRNEYVLVDDWLDRKKYMCLSSSSSIWFVIWTNHHQWTIHRQFQSQTTSTKYRSGQSRAGMFSSRKYVLNKSVRIKQILFNQSIYENIRYGKVNATRAEIEDAARQANAHNFIMELPYVCIHFSLYFFCCSSIHCWCRDMKHWLVNVVFSSVLAKNSA